MLAKIRPWLPELSIALVALFFVYRELGTFPDAWQDDSLFMIVARSLAEGRGYSLPIFKDAWHFPYILGVGPTLIVPVALFIKIAGFSVAVARFPMTLYLLGSIYLFYVYTQSIVNRSAARWSTALLVTLSAFINTGKPVLGEVPAFFFLLLGFLALRNARYAWAGVAFGLCVVTKLSFAMIFPAAFIAGAIAIVRRDKAEIKGMLTTGIIAAVFFVAWLAVEKVDILSLFGEASYHSSDDASFLRTIFTHPEAFLRHQYLYFTGLLGFAAVGWWSLRKRMASALWITSGAFVVIFILYFLNGQGWYRHLLPAHLVLLSFVPTGALRIVRNRFALTGMLSFFILAQFWWQLDHQGSRRSDEAMLAAQRIEEDFSETTMVISQAEIFVRLPENLHWMYLSDELAPRSDYSEFASIPIEQKEHCLPLLRKMAVSEKEQYGERITDIHGRYYLLAPPEECEE